MENNFHYFQPNSLSCSTLMELNQQKGRSPRLGRGAGHTTERAAGASVEVAVQKGTLL